MKQMPVSVQRVKPRQPRSQATVDVILEAAAQVLESEGEAGFNTNAVAERAGVGIGSVYRYFPDKQAILLEMGRREMAHVGAQIAAGPGSRPQGVSADRHAIRSFLRAFGERTKARRAVVQILLRHLSPAELQAAFARAEARMATHAERPMGRVQLFVLSRALLGAMRAAVLEEADFLLSQEFEDELVRLSRAYGAAGKGELAS